MRHCRSMRHRGWLPLALAVAASLAGCTKWSTVEAGPETYLSTKSPTRVRVTTMDGVAQILEAPIFIRSDSLLGTRVVNREKLTYRTGVPLEDIAEFEARTADGTATAITVAAVAGVVVLLGVAIASGGDDDPPPPPPSTGGAGAGGLDFSSCPLVYSWDGDAWILDSGTFGGAVFEPLRRTDLDLLEHATAEDGTLLLRMTNELFETDFVDEVAVLAVDVPVGVSVAPDGSGKVHAIRALAAPALATDGRGRDVLKRIDRYDGIAWESQVSGRDTADAADIRDGLLLAFERPLVSTTARLVVDGHNTVWASHLLNEYMALHGSELQSWYDSLNADPGRAYATASRLAKEAFLSVAVRTAEGWQPQGLIWEAGPEIIKRQVHELDLAQVDGDTVWVKLESVPSYWRIDRVAIDLAAPASFTTTELQMVSARDGNDRDVLETLLVQDRKDVTLEPGDEVRLEFRVPPAAVGTERRYVLRTSGWYRLHTQGSGVPDRETIARIDTEPGAISRLSVVEMNRLLAGIAEPR